MQGGERWVRWLSRLGLPPVQTLDTAAHTSLHDPLSSSQLGRLDQLACFHDLLSPDAPPQLQDAVIGSPSFWKVTLDEELPHFGDKCPQAAICRTSCLLALLRSVHRDMQARRPPTLLHKLDSHNAWSHLMQAMTLCFKLRENDSLAAELLVLILQHTAGPQPHQHDTPLLPQHMTQHPAQLEALTCSVLTAAMARLRDCQACPLNPYRTFAPTEPCRALTQYAAHHEEEVGSAQTALGHAHVAMYLLTLSCLLLSHYGQQPPTSAPVMWLARKLISMLVPLKDTVLSCSAGLAAARNSAAGQQGWEVQQFAAAKQRRRLIKLLLNQVLQCLEAVVSSDAGWEGALGVQPGLLERLRQAQQQPVVVVAGAFSTLKSLVSLVQRPAFKGSTVTHALDCLALVSSKLGPVSLVSLSCNPLQPSAETTPGTSLQGGQAGGAVALANLLQHTLGVLTEYEKGPEMLRAALSLLANILDVLDECQEQPAADQEQQVSLIAAPAPHVELVSALQLAGYLSSNVLGCITACLQQQLAVRAPLKPPTQVPTYSRAWQTAGVGVLLQCLRLAAQVRAKLSSLQERQHQQPQQQQQQQGEVMDTTVPQRPMVDSMGRTVQEVWQQNAEALGGDSIQHSGACKQMVQHALTAATPPTTALPATLPCPAQAEVAITATQLMPILSNASTTGDAVPPADQMVQHVPLEHGMCLRLISFPGVASADLTKDLGLVRHELVHVRGTWTDADAFKAFFQSWQPPQTVLFRTPPVLQKAVLVDCAGRVEQEVWQREAGAPHTVSSEAHWQAPAPGPAAASGWAEGLLNNVSSSGAQTAAGVLGFANTDTVPGAVPVRHCSGPEVDVPPAGHAPATTPCIPLSTAGPCNAFGGIVAGQGNRCTAVLCAAPPTAAAAAEAIPETQLTPALGLPAPSEAPTACTSAGTQAGTGQAPPAVAQMQQGTYTPAPRLPDKWETTHILLKHGLQLQLSSTPGTSLQDERIIRQQLLRVRWTWGDAEAVKAFFQSWQPPPAVLSRTSPSLLKAVLVDSGSTVQEVWQRKEQAPQAGGGGTQHSKACKQALAPTAAAETGAGTAEAPQGSAGTGQADHTAQLWSTADANPEALPATQLTTWLPSGPLAGSPTLQASTPVAAAAAYPARVPSHLLPAPAPATVAHLDAAMTTTTAAAVEAPDPTPSTYLLPQGSAGPGGCTQAAEPSTKQSGQAAQDLLAGTPVCQPPVDSKGYKAGATTPQKGQGLIFSIATPAGQQAAPEMLGAEDVMSEQQATKVPGGTTSSHVPVIVLLSSDSEEEEEEQPADNTPGALPHAAPLVSSQVLGQGGRHTSAAAAAAPSQGAAGAIPTQQLLTALDLPAPSEAPPADTSAGTQAGTGQVHPAVAQLQQGTCMLVVPPSEKVRTTHILLKHGLRLQLSSAPGTSLQDESVLRQPLLRVRETWADAAAVKAFFQSWQPPRSVLLCTPPAFLKAVLVDATGATVQEVWQHKADAPHCHHSEACEQALAPAAAGAAPGRAEGLQSGTNSDTSSDVLGSASCVSTDAVPGAAQGLHYHVYLGHGLRLRLIPFPGACSSGALNDETATRQSLACQRSTWADVEAVQAYFQTWQPPPAVLSRTPPALQRAVLVDSAGRTVQDVWQRQVEAPQAGGGSSSQHSPACEQEPAPAPAAAAAAGTGTGTGTGRAQAPQSSTTSAEGTHTARLSLTPAANLAASPAIHEGAELQSSPLPMSGVGPALLIAPPESAAADSPPNIASHLLPASDPATEAHLHAAKAAVVAAAAAAGLVLPPYTSLPPQAGPSTPGVLTQAASPNIKHSTGAAEHLLAATPVCKPPECSEGRKDVTTRLLASAPQEGHGVVSSNAESAELQGVPEMLGAHDVPSEQQVPQVPGDAHSSHVQVIEISSSDSQEEEEEQAAGSTPDASPHASNLSHHPVALSQLQLNCISGQPHKRSLSELNEGHNTDAPSPTPAAGGAGADAEFCGPLQHPTCTIPASGSLPPQQLVPTATGHPPSTNTLGTADSGPAVSADPALPRHEAAASAFLPRRLLLAFPNRDPRLSMIRAASSCRTSDQTPLAPDDANLAVAAETCGARVTGDYVDVMEQTAGQPASDTPVSECDHGAAQLDLGCVTEEGGPHLDPNLTTTPPAQWDGNALHTESASGGVSQATQEGTQQDPAAPQVFKHLLPINFNLHLELTFSTDTRSRLVRNDIRSVRGAVQSVWAKCTGSDQVVQAFKGWVPGAVVQQRGLLLQVNLLKVEGKTEELVLTVWAKGQSQQAAAGVQLGQATADVQVDDGHVIQQIVSAMQAMQIVDSDLPAEAPQLDGAAATAPRTLRRRSGTTRSRMLLKFDLYLQLTFAPDTSSDVKNADIESLVDCVSRMNEQCSNTAQVMEAWKGWAPQPGVLQRGALVGVDLVQVGGSFVKVVAHVWQQAQGQHSPPAAEQPAAAGADLHAATVRLSDLPLAQGPPQQQSQSHPRYMQAGFHHLHQHGAAHARRDITLWVWPAQQHLKGSMAPADGTPTQRQASRALSDSPVSNQAPSGQASGKRRRESTEQVTINSTLLPPLSSLLRPSATSATTTAPYKGAGNDSPATPGARHVVWHPLTDTGGTPAKVAGTPAAGPAPVSKAVLTGTKQNRGYARARPVAHGAGVSGKAAPHTISMPAAVPAASASTDGHRKRRRTPFRSLHWVPSCTLAEIPPARLRAAGAGSGAGSAACQPPAKRHMTRVAATASSGAQQAQQSTAEDQLLSTQAAGIPTAVAGTAEGTCHTPDDVLEASLAPSAECDLPSTVHQQLLQVAHICNWLPPFRGTAACSMGTPGLMHVVVPMLQCSENGAVERVSSLPAAVVMQPTSSNLSNLHSSGSPSMPELDDADVQDIVTPASPVSAEGHTGLHDLVDSEVGHDDGQHLEQCPVDDEHTAPAGAGAAAGANALGTCAGGSAAGTSGGRAASDPNSNTASRVPTSSEAAAAAPVASPAVVVSAGLLATNGPCPAAVGFGSPTTVCALDTAGAGVSALAATAVGDGCATAAENGSTGTKETGKDVEVAAVIPVLGSAVVDRCLPHGQHLQCDQPGVHQGISTSTFQGFQSQSQGDSMQEGHEEPAIAHQEPCPAPPCGMEADAPAAPAEEQQARGATPQQAVKLTSPQECEAPGVPEAQHSPAAAAQRVGTFYRSVVSSDQHQAAVDHAQHGVVLEGGQQQQQQHMLSEGQPQQEASLPTAVQKETHPMLQPWGGLSCYELWSVCAYAVQGVVQQVCGGTPPSPGGLDACLAAVQLHGFLVRLAAGWWANPEAALEWLAAGFPQLSSAVPAVGRALAQHRAENNSNQSAACDHGKEDPARTYPHTACGAAHFNETQLQYCLSRLDAALHQAGADELMRQEVRSWIHSRVAAEEVCAHRGPAAPVIAAPAGAAVIQAEECTVIDSSDLGCDNQQDGVQSAERSCLKENPNSQRPCLPCSAGRSSHQLMIAVAGAEGLALLGVSAQCLADWVCMAMGSRSMQNFL